jgi:hypothetical protein
MIGVTEVVFVLLACTVPLAIMLWLMAMTVQIHGLSRQVAVLQSDVSALRLASAPPTPAQLAAPVSNEADSGDPSPPGDNPS